MTSRKWTYWAYFSVALWVLLILRDVYVQEPGWVLFDLVSLGVILAIKSRYRRTQPPPISE